MNLCHQLGMETSSMNFWMKVYSLMTAGAHLSMNCHLSLNVDLFMLKTKSIYFIPPQNPHIRPRRRR